MLKLKDELIQKLLKENEEFNQLYYEHMSLEQDLEALYSLKYFPPEVEIKIKEIKKRKLKCKDRMEQIAAELG
ncbi:MAG: uncharacterized protein PWQ25_1307 [Deferribacteres bacterium]|jgi:uncharacterized protein YdcH (DUF465 family)|nr:hypothetical protein [Deferribacteraceae bacterium]MDK2792444.1 uncharacterized protein [Deferribacteres bacterium]